MLRNNIRTPWVLGARLRIPMRMVARSYFGEVIAGDPNTPYISGPNGNVYKISYVISRIGKKVIRLSNLKLLGYRLYRVRKTRQPFCLE